MLRSIKKWLRKQFPRMFIRISMSQISKDGNTSQSIRVGRIFSWGKVHVTQSNDDGDMQQSIRIRR